MKYIWLSVISLVVYMSIVEASETFKPVAIVELFTSEGCSSCPSADDILAKLAIASREQGLQIFPLSFHVDYWNYLGWRDPYSQKEFSVRQAWYAKHLNDNVYTPQAIINGRYSLVGSESSKIQSLVNKSLTEPSSAHIELMNIKIDEKSILGEFKLYGNWTGKNIAVALVERGVSVDVARGENAGRKLRHSNVVKEFKLLAPQKDDGSFVFTSPSLNSIDQYSIIAYVQESNLPEILGASKIDLK